MLSGLQDLVGALATDRALRERFFADRESVLIDRQLSDQERQTLRTMSRGSRIERYAHGLVAKRWGEVARVIPRTRKVCPSIERRYRSWLETHPAPAIDTVLPPGVAELLRALDPLASAIAKAGAECVWAPDLLAYEALGAAARADGIVRSRAVRYDVRSIVAEMRGGSIPLDPAPRPGLLTFERERVLWSAAGAGTS